MSPKKLLWQYRKMQTNTKYVSKFRIAFTGKYFPLNILIVKNIIQYTLLKKFQENVGIITLVKKKLKSV